MAKAFLENFRKPQAKRSSRRSISPCGRSSIAVFGAANYLKILEGINKFGTKNEPTVIKVERFLKSAGITDEEIAKFRSIMLPD